MTSQISLSTFVFLPLLFSSLLLLLLSFPSPTVLRYIRRDEIESPQKEITVFSVFDFPCAFFFFFFKKKSIQLLSSFFPSTTSLFDKVSLFISPALLSHIPPFPALSSLRHNHRSKTLHANKFFTPLTIDVPHPLSCGLPRAGLARGTGRPGGAEERVRGGIDN